MNAKRSATYLLTAIVVRMFMLGAAGVSFSHIIATSQALVDGLAVLGMIGRSGKFAASTQRAGLRLMIGAGALSLACNVYAGHNLGQRLYGVLIVAGFVVSEWYAAKLRPATNGPSAEDLAAAELAAKRSAAAVKAAATRKRNTDAAAKAERAETRRIRAAARALEAA
jgi:hypothetical protein